MTRDELDRVLTDHAAWLRGEGGARADLAHANLVRANLIDANLARANLADTCLDPTAPVPHPTAEECVAAGFALETVDGRARVHGWRTLYSQHIGSYEYTPGAHVVPWFSVAATTACHPGIYLATREWLEREYPGAPLVRCWAWLDEVVHAEDKWRAKRIVVADEGVRP